MTRKAFRTEFNKYLKIQVFLLGLPVAFYLYSIETVFDRLRVISILLLLISQILLAWNFEKKIRSRIKAINPNLTNKEAAKAIIYLLLPLTIVPFGFYLLNARSGSQKGGLFIKNPFKIFLALNLVGLLLLSLNFNKTGHFFFTSIFSQVLTEFSSTREIKRLSANGLSPEEILLKMPEGPISFLQKAGFAASAIRDKQRLEKPTDGPKEKVNETLVFIKSMSHLYFNKPYYINLSNFNPALYLSPFSTIELGFTLLVNEILHSSAKKNLRKKLKFMVLTAINRYQENADEETLRKISELRSIDLEE